MSVTTADFWKLLAESQLLDPQQGSKWLETFARSRTARAAGGNPDAKTLAEWLVGKNVLSKYQATILLAGRNGPFHFGDYNVYDRVDKGRLSGQFRAIHRPTGHPVLLQFLTGQVIQHPSLWAAAASDTLAASHFVSPHLQRFYEPVDLSSFKFLVGEDLRGSSAEEQLASGRMSPPEACRLIRLAALGLVTMHQAGRVHGDVRPGQIWIEPAAGQQPGNVKLLFSPHEIPAPILWSSPEEINRLNLTADYLAPELAQPGKSPDPLTDVYALGCSLYCLLTGSPPFAGGNLQQKMQRHAVEAIRPLEQFGVPPQLAMLVAYMMAKNPAVRLQAASIVAEQLTPFVDQQGLYALPPEAPPSTPHYEQWIRQRQAAVQAHAAALANPTAIPIQLNIKTEAAAPASPAISFDAGVTSGSSSLARSRKSANTMPLMVGGGVLVLALLGALVFILNSGKPTEVAQPPKDQSTTEVSDKGGNLPAIVKETNPGKDPIAKPPAKENSKQKAPAKEKSPPAETKGPTKTPTTKEVAVTGDSGFQQEVVPDDGNTLWASPTTGKAVAFRCVPPVGQIFIVCRPAEMLASTEGKKVFEALGPNFAAQRTTWEKASGCTFDQVERLIVSFHNNNAKFPRLSFVVKLKTAQTTEELLEKWGSPAPLKEEDKTYYTGNGWSYFIPSLPEDAGTFLMGDAEDVKEVAKVNGTPPVLFREIEKLRRSTDENRHLTILFNPSFFNNDDGQPLFTAEREKLREPLSWILGDDLKGGLLSLHFQSEFYFEARLLASLNKEKYALASDMRERLKQIPNQLTDYAGRLSPSPYWSRLWFNYPGIVRKLHSNMRVGVENDEAIVNSILPLPAAHNLVLGGELLLATAPGAAVAAVGPGNAYTGPKTLEEAIVLKTSFSFAQTSLEFAMRDLGNEVNDLVKGAPFQFSIKILGDDLKLDGITRNQSIRDFKQEGKSISEILTALVMKANPVTTVKDPSEADQKLLWVVAPDPDAPDKQIVVITTRQMAEKRKYKLPPNFILKDK